MRVIAVCSGKGGVGKTSAAVNLAALAARSLRVVLWDLDPQGGATQCLATDTARRGFTKDLVRGRRSLVDAAIATHWEGLAVVAADRAARNVDRFLDAGHLLSTRLRPLDEHYDVVVLDCPPGDDVLVAHVVEAADGLFVSLVPNPMSIRALDQIAALVTDFAASSAGSSAAESRDGRGRPTLLPFFSAVDRRNPQHRETVEALQLARPETLSAQIPVSDETERVPVYRTPIVTRVPDAPSARAFAELWREAQLRLAWDERPVERV